MSSGLFGLGAGATLGPKELKEAAALFLTPEGLKAAATIGTLLRSPGAESAAPICLALATYILTALDPALPLDDTDTAGWTKLSIRTVRACPLRAATKWKDHLMIWPDAGKVESAEASPYLAQVLTAIEDFFGQPGLLLLRSVAE